MLLDEKSIKEKHEQISHYISELDQLAELPHVKALGIIHDYVIEQEIKKLFEIATQDDAWGRIQKIRGMLSMHIDKVMAKVEYILKEKKK